MAPCGPADGSVHVRSGNDWSGEDHRPPSSQAVVPDGLLLPVTGTLEVRGEPDIKDKASVFFHARIEEEASGERRLMKRGSSGGGGV